MRFAAPLALAAALATAARAEIRPPYGRAVEAPLLGAPASGWEGAARLASSVATCSS